MTITVKFFASLRESLNMSQIELESDGPLSVRQVWMSATHNAPFAPNTLCAINHEHANIEQQAVNGDEVAFFPPVTGG
ncbi:MAG TPA: molybdopterin synthase sulfur carrier subunit [Gammaproteobacteria bacterium]|nr:molybdopterin synthase sulfur carrier subunit [Gammaproteobacteria bacterium]